jgi:hypothetical protein
VAGEPPPAASGKARRIAKPRTKPEPPKPVAESASVALERAADGDEGTPKRELPAPVPPAEPLRKPTKRAAKKPRRQAGPTGKPASSKKAASAKKGGAKKSLARSGAKPLNKTKKKSAPSRKTSTKATKRTLSQAKRAASAKKNAAKKAAPKKKSSKTKR